MSEAEFWLACSYVNSLEGFISLEIFVYIFINSDPNLTQTLLLTLKPSPYQTLT